MLHSSKTISISFSVIVTMSIPIPGFTTLLGTVSKHFIKRESRDKRTVNQFGRRRRDVAGLLSNVRDTTNIDYIM